MQNTCFRQLPICIAIATLTAMTAAQAQTTATPLLRITDVQTRGNDTSVVAPADWFELTNMGSEPVNIAGFQMSDNEPAEIAPLQGSITSIAPGESIVFFENATAIESQVAAFQNYWTTKQGLTLVRSGGFHRGLGNGDEVHVYDSTGTEITSVTFTSHSGGNSDNTTGRQQCHVYSYSAEGTPTGLTQATCSPGRTDTSVTLPSAPTGLTASAITGNGFTLEWADVGTETGYVVEVATDAAFSTIVKDAATAANVTSVILDGLEPTTAYHVRLRAVNTGGSSNFATTEATTIAGNSTPLFVDLVDNTIITGVHGESSEFYASNGLKFTVADDDTLANLSVTAQVTPAGFAQVDASAIAADGTVTLTITPLQVGYADITITVTDAQGAFATRTLKYAASANTTANAATQTRWLSGRSDLSTAVRIDGTLLTADDEDPNLILAYDFDYADATKSGSRPPLWTWRTPDTGANSLGLGGDGNETDLEAGAAIGNTIYWTGSHGNNKSGNVRTDRQRIFATQYTPQGTEPLEFKGQYSHLQTDIRNWDKNNAHGLGANFLQLDASASAGIAPESDNLDGFSIEGLSFAADNTTGWVGMRAPLVAPPGVTGITANSPTNRTHALIVPVTNFTILAQDDNLASGSAVFSAPIFLDLGGRGIREIQRNANGSYLIIAGPPNGATGIAPQDFRLFTWDGSVDANNEAVNLARLNANLTSMLNGIAASPEGLVDVPADLNDASALVGILSDAGDFEGFYGDGKTAKDLDEAYRKSRVDQIALGSIDDGRFLLTAATSSGSTGYGTVNCADNILAYGATTTCTASANAGYQFSEWQLSGMCTSTSTLNPQVDITAQSACSITAEFVTAVAETPTYKPAVALPASQGTASFRISSDMGDTCRIDAVAFNTAPSLPAGATAFPYGVADFRLDNCATGATATIEITYPNSIEGMDFWKLLGTTWHQLPATITGNTVRFQIQDGGPFDTNSTDGVIADPSGPAIRANSMGTNTIPVPVMPVGLLAVMAAILGGIGMRFSHKRQS